MIRHLILVANLLLSSIAITASAPGGAGGAGHALEFRKDGQCVYVPDSDSLDVTGPLTIEAWVKPEAGILSRGYCSIISKQMGGTGYMLSTNYHGPRHAYKCEVGGLSVASDSSPEIGRWTHVAGVWENGQLRIYINGELDGTTNTSAPTSNLGGFFIGASPFGASTNWRGMIDEVRVWATARTEGQIEWGMQHSVSAGEAGLRACWSLDEGAGQAVNDLTGQNPGRLGSSPNPDADDPTWVSGVELSGSDQYQVFGYVRDWDGGPIEKVKVQVWRHFPRVGAGTMWTDYTKSDGYYITPWLDRQWPVSPDTIAATLDSDIVRVSEGSSGQTISKGQSTCGAAVLCERDFVFGTGLGQDGEKDGVLTFCSIHKAKEYVNGVYDRRFGGKVSVRVRMGSSYQSNYWPLISTIRLVDGPTVYEIWHEYGHFIQHANYGWKYLLEMNRSGTSQKAFTEGWATYFGWLNDPEEADNQLETNLTYRTAGGADSDHRWGWVYAGVFNDIRDGVNWLDSDALDGSNTGYSDGKGEPISGEQMIWNVIMEEKPKNIEAFFWKFVIRYPRLLTDLLDIYRSHGIPGFVQSAGITSSNIQPSQSEVLSRTVDSAADVVRFELLWPGSDLDLELVSPSGVVVDPCYAAGDPNIEYVEEQTQEYYVVENPEPGEWQMRIRAVDVPPQGEEYTASAHLTTNLVLILSTDKETYAPNEPVLITGELLYDANGYSGAEVTAAIAGPDGNETIALFDDGLHNDGDSGDGIYAQTFADTAAEGEYEITATAAGTNPFDEPFLRETSKSVAVESLADPAAIELTADYDPIEGQVAIGAIVLNGGPKDANDILVRFYDVNDSNTIQIGNDLTIEHLGAGESREVSAVWEGSRGVRAVFVVVDPEDAISESDETNNYLVRAVCTGGEPEGDVDGDCVVNLKDLAELGGQWLASCSGPMWCGEADLDESGQVNLADVGILAGHWLEELEP